MHWERPNLGLVQYRGSGDNNILAPAAHDPVQQAGWNGGTVFHDPSAPQERRYKLWSEIRVAEEGKSGLSGFHSPDGLHWTACANNPVPGYADCLNVAFWDERIEQYVGYSRHWTADSRGDFYRSVRRLVSPDFENWQDLGAVLAADETDLTLPVKRNRESRQIVDFHGNCVFRYPGTSDVYLALPEAWWHWSANPFPEGGRDQEKMGGFPDTVDVQLATSRDGIKWQRAGGRNPFLRLGPPDAGDSKMIYAFTQPVPVGDELWVYYGGFRYGISEKVALKRGAYLPRPSTPGRLHLGRCPLRRRRAWSQCPCVFAAANCRSTPIPAPAARSAFRSRTGAASRWRATTSTRPTKSTETRFVTSPPGKETRSWASWWITKCACAS